MTTKQQIFDDFIKAFKAKDDIRKRTLASIKAEILVFEKQKEGNEAVLEKIVEILKSMAKKRREAIEAYEAAGRTELAQREKEELEVIESYLPAQLSAAQIRETAERIVSANGFGKADFGKAMGAVMTELKGKADGNTVSAIIKEILGS
jgi:hypothetical protein